MWKYNTYLKVRVYIRHYNIILDIENIHLLIQSTAVILSIIFFTFTNLLVKGPDVYALKYLYKCIEKNVLGTSTKAKKKKSIYSWMFSNFLSIFGKWFEIQWNYKKNYQIIATKFKTKINYLDSYYMLFIHYFSEKFIDWDIFQNHLSPATD